MWQTATKDTVSDRVRARIKTRAAEPQALQDCDRVAAGIGDNGGVGCFF